MMLYGSLKTFISMLHLITVLTVLFSVFKADARLTAQSAYQYFYETDGFDLSQMTDSISGMK